MVGLALKPDILLGVGKTLRRFSDFPGFGFIGVAGIPPPPPPPPGCIGVYGLILGSTGRLC